MIRLLIVLVTALILAACAKRPYTSSIGHVIPLPRAVEPHDGEGFTISANTVVVVSPGDGRGPWIAKYLADLIGLAAAPQPPRVDVAGPAIPRGAISLELGVAAIAGAQAYELVVTPGGVTIRANQPAGLFYGVQSFRQLLPAFIEYRAIRPESGASTRRSSTPTSSSTAPNASSPSCRRLTCRATPTRPWRRMPN